MITYIEILDKKYLVDPANIYRYGCMHTNRRNLSDNIYIDVWHKTLRQRVVQSTRKEYIRVLTNKEAFLLSMKDPEFNDIIYSSDFCDHAR